MGSLAHCRSNIADSGSNVAEVFRDFEYKRHKDLLDDLGKLGEEHGILRIGYWEATDDQTDIFYGIRFMKWDGGNSFISYTRVNHIYDHIDPDMEHIDHAPGAVCMDNPYPIEGIIDQKTISGIYLRAIEMPVFQGKAACSSEYARYRMTLSILSGFFLSFMFLFDFSLIIACIVAIVKGCAKPNGSFTTISLRSTRKGQTTNGLASALSAFFYTSRVGILFAFFATVWNPADDFYRRMQPLAGMSLPKQAEENLLLDYVGTSAIQVLLSAVMNQHWRVACLAILVNLHPFTPIIARKVFVFVNEGDVVKVKAVPAWFYVGFTILVIYPLILGYARPPWRYRAPRDLQSFVDVISFCAYSRIVDEAEFNIPDNTDEEVRFFSPIHAAKKRYMFGYYKGKDGRRHIGFDVSERGEGQDAVRVDVVGPGVFMDWFFARSWWIRPCIVRVDERLMRIIWHVPRMRYKSSWGFRRLLRTGTSARPGRDAINAPAHAEYEMIQNT